PAADTEAMDYRGRERLVLRSGLAAAGFVALALVAGIAGSPFGRTGDKLVVSLVLLYLCARMWGHATTLAERGTKELLARTGQIGAPIVLLLLLAQTWASAGIDVRL